MLLTFTGGESEDGDVGLVGPFITSDVEESVEVASGGSTTTSGSEE